MEKQREISRKEAEQRKTKEKVERKALELEEEKRREVEEDLKKEFESQQSDYFGFNLPDETNWDGNGRSLEEVEGCTAEEYYSKKKGIVSDYSAKDGNGSQPEEEFGSSK